MAVGLTSRLQTADAIALLYSIAIKEARVRPDLPPLHRDRWARSPFVSLRAILLVVCLSLYLNPRVLYPACIHQSHNHDVPGERIPYGNLCCCYLAEMSVKKGLCNKLEQVKAIYEDYWYNQRSSVHCS